MEKNSCPHHNIPLSDLLTRLSFLEAPFHSNSPDALPELYSEPAEEKFLDDMDECPRPVSPNIDI